MSNGASNFSEQSPAADDAFSYEMDDAETVTEAILAAVTTVTGDALVPIGDGADSSGLPPLYTVVDTDAIESLFRSPGSGGRTSGYVQFRYADCTVTVESDGRILVQQETDEPL